MQVSIKTPAILYSIGMDFKSILASTFAIIMLRMFQSFTVVTLSGVNGEYAVRPVEAASKIATELVQTPLHPNTAKTVATWGALRIHGRVILIRVEVNTKFNN